MSCAADWAENDGIILCGLCAKAEIERLRDDYQTLLDACNTEINERKRLQAIDATLPKRERRVGM
jgi:hypothetical protein